MAQANEEQIQTVEVDIEYCGNCAFQEECQKIAKIITESQPNSDVKCRRGRRGSFEVTVDEKLVFSRLNSDRWPKAEEIAKLIGDASSGHSSPALSSRCRLM